MNNGKNVTTGNAIGIKVDNGGVADILNNLIHDCYDRGDYRNRIIGIGVWVQDQVGSLRLGEILLLDVVFQHLLTMLQILP